MTATLPRSLQIDAKYLRPLSFQQANMLTPEQVEEYQRLVRMTYNTIIGFRKRPVTDTSIYSDF